jgi:hypothetical protein
VRKGVDLVVELSHRLADLEGQVRVLVIGGPTTWSDYRNLLVDLNPKIAEYLGDVSPSALRRMYQGAALQPSNYEPFALTGSSRRPRLSSAMRSRETPIMGLLGVPHGDRDAFESAVRSAITARAQRRASRGLAPQRLLRASDRRGETPDELDLARRSAVADRSWCSPRRAVQQRRGIVELLRITRSSSVDSTASTRRRTAPILSLARRTRPELIVMEGQPSCSRAFRPCS